MGVTIKAAGELKLNDSPVNYPTFWTIFPFSWWFKKSRFNCIVQNWVTKLQHSQFSVLEFIWKKKRKLAQSLQTLLKFFFAVLSFVHLIKWEY